MRYLYSLALLSSHCDIAGERIHQHLHTMSHIEMSGYSDFLEYLNTLVKFINLFQHCY